MKSRSFVLQACAVGVVTAALLLTACGGLSPLCTRGAAASRRWQNFLCLGKHNRPWFCCPARERSMGPASRWPRLGREKGRGKT